MTSILDSMVNASKTPKTNESESENFDKRNDKVRSNMIHLRVNDYELDILTKTALKLGAPKSTALRMAMLEYCRKHGVI